MAEQKLRLAGIGCKHQGLADIQRIASHAASEYVAFCDIDQRHFDYIDKTWPDAPRYSDFRKLFADFDGKIDAVSIGVPDHPDAWASIGCTVVGGAVPFSNGALLLGGAGLVIADVPPSALASELEGIPLSAGAEHEPVEHAGGAFELDHLVLLTDSLERTSEAVEAVLGLECRRVRETDTVRQAFHRFADVPTGVSRGCIVEVVESDRVERTTLMGIVLNVTDLFEMADRFGPDVMGLPKPGVQRGRYISTVRRDVGLGIAVALMTPEPSTGQ